MAELRPEDEKDVDCVREAHGDTELPYTWDDIGCMMTVRQLCDSHESLRAALDAAVLDAARKAHNLQQVEIDRLRAALDAANARADEALKVSVEKLAALINPELSDARMTMIAVAEARASKAELALAAMTMERDAAQSPDRCPYGETRACAKEATEDRTRLRNDLAAALARVAEVEAQRNQARRLYCREHAKYGERIYGKGDQCRWNEPRKVCLVEWPDQADKIDQGDNYVEAAERARKEAGR